MITKYASSNSVPKVPSTPNCHLVFPSISARILARCISRSASLPSDCARLNSLTAFFSSTLPSKIWLLTLSNTPKRRATVSSSVASIFTSSTGIEKFLFISSISFWLFLIPPTASSHLDLLSLAITISCIYSSPTFSSINSICL